MHARNWIESSEAKAQRLSQEATELFQENDIECDVSIEKSRRQENSLGLLLFPRFFQRFIIRISFEHAAAETCVDNSPFKRNVTLKRIKWRFSTDTPMFCYWITNKTIGQVAKMVKQSHVKYTRKARLLKIFTYF